MATGGPKSSRRPGVELGNVSQVVDVSSTKSCYSSLQPYPFKLLHGTGSVLNGSPMICGGTFVYGEEHKVNSEWLFCLSHLVILL